MGLAALLIQAGVFFDGPKSRVISSRSDRCVVQLDQCLCRRGVSALEAATKMAAN